MSQVATIWWRLLVRAGRLRAGLQRPKFVAFDGSGPVIVISVFLAFTAVVFSSCGGGSKPAPASPEATPVNGDTVAASPTTALATPTPVPTPEPTPTPEALSDDEIAARLADVVQLVNEVADAYPTSEILRTIRTDAQTALADYDNVIETKDYKSILTPLTAFGNIGHHIYEFACFTTEGNGEPEVQAWAAIKELVLDACQKYEDLGFLEVGMTQTCKETFFTVHESCTNPAISSN